MILSQVVALRKESVDRNKNNILGSANIFLSLSARRAWIEIKALQVFFMSEEQKVALRKESVDRNFKGLWVWR